MKHFNLVVVIGMWMPFCGDATPIKESQVSHDLGGPSIENSRNKYKNVII